MFRVSAIHSRKKFLWLGDMSRTLTVWVVAVVVTLSRPVLPLNLAGAARRVIAPSIIVGPQGPTRSMAATSRNIPTWVVLGAYWAIQPAISTPGDQVRSTTSREPPV